VSTLPIITAKLCVIIYLWFIDDIFSSYLAMDDRVKRNCKGADKK